MRAMIGAAVAAVALYGCGEKAPGSGSPAGTTDNSKSVPAAAPAGTGGPQNPRSTTLRLVKTADSASVFAIEDGKKSAISSWGWVEAHAPGQPIETVSASELASYPDSGTTYK